METNSIKIKITIDGKEIFLDEELSILDAARQNNIHIPTLCHHPDLSAWGGCRLCLVEVDGSPRLAASCVTPVRNGMEIISANEKIIQARRTILEFLFAERNHNCMFCPESGDCELQNLAYELQMDHLTASSSFDKFPTDMTSPVMAFDHNRCVLCGRCVRACREISGARVLDFIHRGPKNLIGFDLNETRENSTCHSCGVCLQVCPTGALSNRYRSHYSVKGHDQKDWHKIESFCPLCGLLCPTTSIVHDNNLLKVEAKINQDRPDRGQLCVKGRFEVLRTKGQRLTHPIIQNKNNTWENTTWENAFDLVGKKLNQIASTNGGDAIFGLVSSYCANEHLLLFKDLMTNGWESGYIDTFDGHDFRTIQKAWERLDGQWQEASWEMIPKADFILMMGATPYQSQPVIHSLIHRSILENKTRVASIGNNDHPLPFATWQLPINNGEESLLTKAMLIKALDLVKDPFRTTHWKNIYKETKDIVLADIINKLGLDEKGFKIFHDILKSFSASLNPLIITGQGLTGLKDVSGFHDTINMSLLKGFISENVMRIIILKPCGNSAGAWQLGISSPKAPSRSNDWKGGLLLLSGEEAFSHEFSNHINDLDFLGVISPFFPLPLDNKADIIIPIPLWMEEDGTYTAMDGHENVFKRRVLSPPDNVRDTRQVLTALAKKAEFYNQNKPEDFP